MARTRFLGSLPSFQSCINTLNGLRRQLNCSHLNEMANHRVTYPYLDRDLLVFLFAIPRDQLVRPHQRRSLMRRALVGLVPDEIFARKRKAFVARYPLKLMESARPNIEALLQSSLTVAYGWTDPATLAAKLEFARRSKADLAIAMLATLKLELWLQTSIHRPEAIYEVRR